MKKWRVTLGNAEIERLKNGRTVILRFGGDEVEIKASMLVKWNTYSEGSFESMIEALKR